LKQKFFPLTQKRITALHIHSHTNYNVQTIFLVIEKRAAGIHLASAGQGHCEGQRKDCRDGSVGGLWLKWCLLLLLSLLMSPCPCNEENATYGWSYERLLKKTLY